MPGCLGPDVMLLEFCVGKRREELVRVPDPAGSGHAIEIRVCRKRHFVGYPHEAHDGVGCRFPARERRVEFHHEMCGDEIVRVGREPRLRELVDIRVVALPPVLRDGFDGV